MDKKRQNKENFRKYLDKIDIKKVISDEIREDFIEKKLISDMIRNEFMSKVIVLIGVFGLGFLFGLIISQI